MNNPIPQSNLNNGAPYGVDSDEEARQEMKEEQAQMASLQRTTTMAIAARNNDHIYHPIVGGNGESHMVCYPTTTATAASVKDPTARKGRQRKDESLFDFLGKLQKKSPSPPPTQKADEEVKAANAIDHASLLISSRIGLGVGTPVPTCGCSRGMSCHVAGGAAAARSADHSRSSSSSDDDSHHHHTKDRY